MLAGGHRPGGVEAAQVGIRRSVRLSVVLLGPAPGFRKPAVPRHQGLEWIVRDAEPLLCCLSGARLRQGGQGKTAGSLEEVTALNPHAATLFRPCDQRSPKEAQSVASEPTTGSTVGWMVVGSSGLGRRGCVGTGDVALCQGSPESDRTGDYRFNASGTGLNGGRLAAHQLYGEGTNDEGTQETRG